MKYFIDKIKPIIGGAIAVASILLILYLSKDHNGQYLKDGEHRPKNRDIAIKEILFGTIEPHSEIEMKSRISGILEKVYVKEGTIVSKGTPIGRVRPISSPRNLENAKNDLEIAKSNVKLISQKFSRAQHLIQNKLISLQEFQNIENEHKVAKQKYNTAYNQLNLVRKGYLKDKEESNIIISQISGTILSIPIYEGSFVTEQTSINRGSTIAIVGDMDNMLFRAYLSENEVIALKIGIPLVVSIPSINVQNIPVTITKISPRGAIVRGAMKYLLEAKFNKKIHSDMQIRAGYNAMAEVITNKKENVLSISEKYLHYENNRYFVNIKNKGRIVKKYVDIGISDGVYIEILKGLSLEDVLC